MRLTQAAALVFRRRVLVHQGQQVRLVHQVQEVDGLLPLVIPVDDEVEGVPGLCHQRDELLAGAVRMGLNLRSGSGLEHSVIGHLLRGTEVEVVGEDGDWYEVVVPEATGYVYKDYLDVAEQEPPAAPPEEDGQDQP